MNERTGWRDQALSKRHHEWGFDCPANDIDFLLIEYTTAEPMALVDYKHDRIVQATYTGPQKWPVDRTKANYRAFVKLADRGHPYLPAFAVLYGNDLTWFEADPLNDTATAWVPVRRRMSELAWVTLLYQMRSGKVPVHIIRRLSAKLP